MALNLNGTLTGNMINSLSTVYIASLTPSVIGSFSVLVASIVKWRNLREQVHVLVQLAVADLLAALILMVTSIMNKVDASVDIVICHYFLPLSLTFYFISFLLVVVYAWKSRNAIQGWRESQSDDQGQCARKTVDFSLYALVWLIPFALYLVYIFTDYIQAQMIIPLDDNTDFPTDNAYCTRCILFLDVWKAVCSQHEELHILFIRLFFFFVVIPVMVICSFIYCKVRKWYERREREQAGLFNVGGDAQSRTVISTTRNMVLVILVCWAPALLLILLSTLMIWINIEQRSLFWLYIIQAISVSLQGFLNSMVYAWRRPNFRDVALGERTPLTAYSRPHFFEDSI
ncbi:transmembrane protein 116 [Salarias fasciatus]|uniref:Transmembrane protein 116-like n=1 Tax=Salarias fasciatus TaxID=181472 RepID=A0A672GKM8_SALFA|nr:transmembrane protein 116-like [Salarias fasciatus]